MYNQGNYLQFGQRLPAPPLPPPPPFQQAPPPPQHPITQQGRPSIPPNVGQAGPPPYGRASSGSMQLGPPVSIPPTGMLSSSQSYLIPPPPPPPHVHGTSTPHSYSTAPQSSNWSQNQHNVPPPIPPPGHHLTSRIPPPHPQGQQLYRVPAPPLLPGGIRGIQQAPPPLLPPPTSSYFTPAPFGSFVRPAPESSMGHLPPPPPPPPPSSPPPGPPPLPPSSPPPNTPLHPSSRSPSTAAELSPSSRKPSDVDMVASGVIELFNSDHQSSNDNLRHDKGLNCTGVNGSEVSVKDTLDLNIMSDVFPPPPRPRDEKTVRKIEVLCQYIAKNGHEFEDMTCQKEVGNPEFEFLFGGVPGSEAAISHEYFKWMKKKCSSNELLEKRQNSDISLRPSGVSSSLQPDGTMHADVSHSPAGSDMDMEDDITQPDEAGIGKSFVNANHDSAFISKEVDITVEEHAGDLEHISHKDAKEGSLFCPGSSGVFEEGAKISRDDMQFEQSLMKDGDADSEWPLDRKTEKHSINLHQKMKQSGASAATEVSSSEIPHEIIKGTSPFRLIQDYASDDSSENDNEPHLENVSPGAVSPQVQASTTDLDVLQTGIESKDSSELDKGLEPLSAPVVKGPLNTNSKIPEPSTRTEDLGNSTDSYLMREQAQRLGKSHHSRALVDGGTSMMDFKRNDRLAGDSTAGPKNGGSEKEDINAKLEVDEFGRMVKAGASDSDSDEYTRRRGKRGRSRSRSRSPHARRRSPWRRREKRSHSRSWSPKKRSRSRSPYRHGGEAGGDWTRRDRNHLPLCYDFRRGKCFRGASCRYLHDTEKSEDSRRHKNKQPYKEVPYRLKSLDNLVPENDEVDNQEMQLYQDIHRNRDRVKEESLEPALQCAQIANAPETVNAIQQVGNVPAPPVIDADGEKLLGIENAVDQQSQANLSGPLLWNSNDQLQHNSKYPATDQISAIPAQLSIVERPSNQMSPAKTQLPLSSLSQGSHAPMLSQLPREYNVMPTSNYPSDSASAEVYPPHQGPLCSEQRQLVPPAPSWNPLPPPPPRPQLGVPLSQYQQNQPPPRRNYPSQAFVRPYAAELPTHSHVGDSHMGAYPPVLEPHQHVSPTEELRPRTFPVNYPIPEQLGGPRIFGEENFARLPSQSLVSSSSIAQGNIHPQSLRFSREQTVGRTQSFSGENVPPGRIPVPSSEGHPYMPQYSFQNTVADSISTLGELGKTNLRYATDFPDGGQVSDFGRSRISSHYNPYASTFDQPLSTKFSSGVFSQDTGTSYSDKYGASVGQGHKPVDIQGVGHISSRNMNTSAASLRYLTHNLPRSGGDQYDPLFDSVEPPSNILRKSDQGNKIEGTDNSDMLRLSGSHRPFDVEENSNHKVVVAASTSVENDEFGETADAEVGAVENDSPSSPIDLPDVATGEIEIDQVKNPGKTKKSKDSRSVKLFKVALADFVKEVLKPSWRQGNMSKEAFKTIVKKTVDKVSGAMKKHQLPKSQAKINQYIDSSQRKLTKLVMGYVDKYVKV